MNKLIVCRTKTYKVQSPGNAAKVIDTVIEVPRHMATHYVCSIRGWNGLYRRYQIRPMKDFISLNIHKDVVFCRLAQPATARVTIKE